MKDASTKKYGGKPGPNTYQLKDGVAGIKKEMTESQMMARVAVDTYHAAITVKAFAGGGDRLHLTDLIAEMRTVSKEVSGGDLTRIEGMLANQALALDSIFNNLAQLAGRAEYLKSTETYMRMALKAQSQARSTAEALALLKNPMPYIKQANITNGPQQVNNGKAPVAGAGNLQSAQNELLENQDGNCLDTRAQGASGRNDKDLEAVGAVNRTSHD